MRFDDRLEDNRQATQLAGAAVAHFLRGDREAMLECVRQIPDPPGAWVGLVRFCALTVTALAVDDSDDAAQVAQDLVLRVAELD